MSPTTSNFQMSLLSSGKKRNSQERQRDNPDHLAVNYLSPRRFRPNIVYSSSSSTEAPYPQRSNSHVKRFARVISLGLLAQQMTCHTPPFRLFFILIFAWLPSSVALFPASRASDCVRGECIFLGAAADDDCVSGSLTEPGRGGYCGVLERGLDYVCKGDMMKRFLNTTTPHPVEGYLALLSS